MPDDASPTPPATPSATPTPASPAPRPSSGSPPPLSVEARRDRVGLAGYGCLVALIAGGGLGGFASAFVGLSALVRGTQGKLHDAEEAYALSLSLERALALVGLGALLVLVAAIAGVVLMKELGDDAARRERGPVRG